MEKYLIELPHTNEECLRALEETKAANRELLPVIDWGCTGGNHKGWLTVEARNEEDALGKIRSSFLRGKAGVTKLVKFSPEQIESFHKM